MAELNELRTRLITRHDTEANWIEKNPVLMAGEIAITVSQKQDDGSYSLPKFKVGINDGHVEGEDAVHWKDIPYCVDMDDLLDKMNNIKPTADNTVFTQNMTMTYAFGKYKPGASGSVEVDAKDKSVAQLLQSAFAEESNPTTTQPSASLNSSNIGAKEAGAKVAIAYNITTNAGKYTYGPDTNVTFNGHTATFNGETLEGASGTFKEVQVTDGMSLSISGSVDSSDGAIPKTNLGNEYAAGQIKAKTHTLTKGTLTSYRNWFYGYKTGANKLENPEAITSAEARALTAQNGSFPGTIKTNNMQQMYFLIPKGKKTKVAVSNNVNGAPCTVTKVTDVMVEGANGYTAVAYDLWYVAGAAQDSGENTYKIVVS